MTYFLLLLACVAIFLAQAPDSVTDQAPDHNPSLAPDHNPSLAPNPDHARSRNIYLIFGATFLLLAALNAAVTP